MESFTDVPRIKESSDIGQQQDRVVTEEEWLQKWKTRQIGFHKEQGHPILRKYLDVLLNGRNGLRIFFPLCGKAVEMKWLGDMGHYVVGVELSECALKEFFTEHDLSYSEETIPGISGAKSNIFVYLMMHFRGCPLGVRAGTLLTFCVLQTATTLWSVSGYRVQPCSCALYESTPFQGL
uniref:Uncharacterized protein n=1 Tax=Gopherus agassizii TaxID=38772 RepID=A0A452GQ62_9SAUR